jgi:hypothetical protein
MDCLINFPGYEFQKEYGLPLNIDILTRLAKARESMVDMDNLYQALKVNHILNLDEKEILSRIQDYQMLLWQMLFIYSHRINDTMSSPELTADTPAFYREYFNIPCHEEYMECRGVNIEGLVRAFGLHDGADEIDFRVIALDVIINEPEPMPD